MGFEIPDSVRVIIKRVFACSFIHVFNIPQFVEEIENGVFFNCFDKPEIIFSPGSKLKKLGFKAFDYLKPLRINNENFHTTESGVVMSNNPRGIVFVPKHLTSLTIDPGIEVIYSCEFYRSNINLLFFPNSLKRIYRSALRCSYVQSVNFAGGTELDLLDSFALDSGRVERICLPKVKGKLKKSSLDGIHYCIDFPADYNPEYIDEEALTFYEYRKPSIYCPESSIPAVARLRYTKGNEITIVKDNAFFIFIS